MKKLSILLISCALIVSFMFAATASGSTILLGTEAVISGTNTPAPTSASVVPTASPLANVALAGISYDMKLADDAVDPPVILALQSRIAGHTGLYKDIAITTVDNFVNIRTTASASSEIVGKIYNNSAAHIEATVTNDEGTWYQVYSGSCEGFIKSEYFVTGSEAEAIAPSVSTMYASITADSLRLHSKASLDSETISMLSEDEKYVVTGIENEFAKLQIDDDMEGYVCTDYVTLSVKYKEAISIEEEQAELARLAEIERQRRLAEEKAEKARIAASKAAASSKAKKSSKATTAAPKKKTTEYTGQIGSNGGPTSDERRALCDYAESFVGSLRYVKGGNSLSSGTDCSGFIQQIFKKWGISLPRVSDDQGYCGKSISPDEMRPGDIVYYGGHVAIYIGDGCVVHCSSPTSNPNTKISSWNYRNVKNIVNVWGD